MGQLRESKPAFVRWVVYHEWRINGVSYAHRSFRHSLQTHTAAEHEGLKSTEWVFFMESCEEFADYSYRADFSACALSAG
jgi:hypothetical protein